MLFCSFFFFNDTATTEIYTLSLHDALPILLADRFFGFQLGRREWMGVALTALGLAFLGLTVEQRSEEHTSELQSHSDLVCRLLLEKKKQLKDNQRRPDTAHGMSEHSGDGEA